MATVNVNVQCCHAGYQYDSESGLCLFKYNEEDDVILRKDYSSQKYIYIRVRPLQIKYHLFITSYIQLAAYILSW